MVIRRVGRPVSRPARTVHTWVAGTRGTNAGEPHQAALLIFSAPDQVSRRVVSWPEFSLVRSLVRPTRYTRW